MGLARRVQNLKPIGRKAGTVEGLSIPVFREVFLHKEIFRAVSAEPLRPSKRCCRPLCSAGTLSLTRALELRCLLQNSAIATLSQHTSVILTVPD